LGGSFPNIDLRIFRTLRPFYVLRFVQSYFAFLTPHSSASRPIHPVSWTPTTASAAVANVATPRPTSTTSTSSGGEEEATGPPTRRAISSRDHTAPRKRRGDSTPSTQRSRQSAPLSLDAIAKLDKANAKTGGWKGYDYDEQYLKEVRAKEKALEKDRVKEERHERKKERAIDSDAALEAATRKRRESRQRPAAESKGRGAASDNEGAQRTAAQRMSAHAAVDSRDKRRSHTSAEREERRRAHEEKYTPSEIAEKKERRRQERALRMSEKKRRVVSGPLAEEGGVDDEDYQYMMEKRGGAGAPSELTEEDLAARKKKKKKIRTFLALLFGRYSN
jgi:glucan 1,3-beta-glucosidase